jgi:hypothetical protein
MSSSIRSVVIGFALLAGCGGKAADEIAKLAKEACACKDLACGTAVNKKLDAAIEKLTDEKDLEKVAGPLAQSGECLAKLGVKAE